MTSRKKAVLSRKLMKKCITGFRQAYGFNRCFCYAKFGKPGQFTHTFIDGIFKAVGPALIAVNEYPAVLFIVIRKLETELCKGNGGFGRYFCVQAITVRLNGNVKMTVLKLIGMKCLSVCRINRTKRYAVKIHSLSLIKLNCKCIFKRLCISELYQMLL